MPFSIKQQRPPPLFLLPLASCRIDIFVVIRQTHFIVNIPFNENFMVILSKY